MAEIKTKAEAERIRKLSEEEALRLFSPPPKPLVPPDQIKEARVLPSGPRTPLQELFAPRPRTGPQAPGGETTSPANEVRKKVALTGLELFAPGPGELQAGVIPLLPGLRRAIKGMPKANVPAHMARAKQVLSAAGMDVSKLTETQLALGVNKIDRLISRVGDNKDVSNVLRRAKELIPDFDWDNFVKRLK